MPRYMKALRLGDRQPVNSEEKYLIAWQEWGMDPDAVALAYDKTVLKCHELKWPYLNAILKRWHESGIHTAAEAEAKDRPGKHRDQPSGGDDAWKYV